MSTGPAALPPRLMAAYALVEDLFAGALPAVDPALATAAVLGGRDGQLRVGDRTFPLTGDVIVVGMGKAATRMAWAADQALADLPVRGMVVTKDGHREGELPVRVEVLEASHPLPDQRSMAAGDRLLGLVESARPGDVVVALVSGGGSALAESLLPPVTLTDLRVVTDLLLRAGATINELNAVRRAISRLKAGGLLAASPVPVFALILSDVIGNDLGTIASGAVIPGPSRAERGAEARAVIARFGLGDRLPEGIRAVLDDDGSEGGSMWTGADVPAPIFVGDNTAAVRAMARHPLVARRGVALPPEWQGRVGEAADLGAAFVDQCRSADPAIDVVLGGGEATVTVRGDGEGGRNTEFALAAALRLAALGDDGWVVASLATDGQDALTGVAGAIVDGGSVARAAASGIEAIDALRRNDSLPWCRAGGRVVVPGPTGTNVNDLYIGVRVRR